MGNPQAAGGSSVFVTCCLSTDRKQARISITFTDNVASFSFQSSQLLKVGFKPNTLAKLRLVKIACYVFVNLFHKRNKRKKEKKKPSRLGFVETVKIK